MPPLLVLAIAVAILIALILTEVPVSLSLMTSGVVGIVLLRSTTQAASTLAGAPYTSVAAYNLILVPMFVAMGMFVLQAGIAQDVYKLAANLLGGLKGGLGYATIAACAGFAAVTGSSAATVATIGRLSIHEMRKFGYSAAFASGIVAAGGTLGILIPPSIALVVYGVLTGESIGLLLIAGIVPGIISALLYTIVIWARAGKHVSEDHILHEELDAAASTVIQGASAGYASAAKVLVLLLIVIGGIYSGLFTATESGAVAASVALVLLIWSGARRGRAALIASLRSAISDSVSVSSMIFFLLVGGAVFSFFTVSAGFTRDFTEWIATLNVPPYVIVALFLFAFIPLGMFLDGLSMLLIAVPLMHPAVTALGFDGIWFGILTIKMIELSLITPPIGINVYVVAGTAPGIRIEDAFQGVWPFGLMDIITIAILFAFPAIVLWLPQFARV